MTATVAVSREMRERGTPSVPQKVSVVAQELARREGVSPKTAERWLSEWFGITDMIIGLCRSVNRMAWLNGRLAAFDTERHCGAPLACTADLALAVVKAEHRVEEAIVLWQRDPSASSAAALCRALQLLHCEDGEFHQALRAQS